MRSLEAKTDIWSSERVRNLMLVGLRDQVSHQMRANNESLSNFKKEVKAHLRAERLSKAEQFTEDLIRPDCFMAGEAQPMVESFNIWTDKANAPAQRDEWNKPSNVVQVPNPVSSGAPTPGSKRKEMCTSLPAIPPHAARQPKKLKKLLEKETNIIQIREMPKDKPDVRTVELEVTDNSDSDAIDDPDDDSDNEPDFEKLPPGAKKDNWEFVSADTGLDVAGFRSVRFKRILKKLVMLIVSQYNNRPGYTGKWLQL